MKISSSKRNYFGTRSLSANGSIFGSQHEILSWDDHVRRRTNSYDILQDENGNWVGSQQQLEEMVTSFYKKLFTDDGPSHPSSINGALPTILDDNMAFIKREVTQRDILNVIKHMNPFKALGVDGLQAGFFQSQWHVIGETVCNLILDIFKNTGKVSDINETLITLVPKVDPVVRIRNFRPITLCNVSYKIVTKILVQRLQGLMGSLVNSC